MDHFSEAKYIDRKLRVGRPLSRCIQMMNYEYRSEVGKKGVRERRAPRRIEGGIWEVVTEKGEAGKLFASRQAQKANLRMRCAAAPMRPVGPSLDFDQV